MASSSGPSQGHPPWLACEAFPIPAPHSRSQHHDGGSLRLENFRWNKRDGPKTCTVRHVSIKRKNMPNKNREPRTPPTAISPSSNRQKQSSRMDRGWSSHHETFPCQQSAGATPRWGQQKCDCESANSLGG